MKLELYEEFLLLSRLGSYSAAAAELPFSQAALTQHIQQMEEELGVKLFHRTTRRVELTEQGKLLLPYAQEICKLKENALSAISTQITHQHFDIVLGFHPLAARYRVNDVTDLFQKAHPQISLAIREQDPERLTKAFALGEYDFIIMEELDTAHSDTFQRVCLNKDDLVAVVPASHPLASYGEALMTQLSNEKFCMQPENTFIYRLATSICEKRGFLPMVTYTSQVLSNIVDMVGKNAGVALLMRRPAEQFKTPAVSLVGIIPPAFSSINLLYREEKLSPEGKCFLEFMKSSAHRQ